MINKATAGILALSLIAGSAYAQDAAITEGKHCFNGTAADGVCPKIALADREYVKENFSFNVSAGVNLGNNQSGAAVAVNTAHDDGRYSFGGSSEGGAVQPCEDAPLGPGEAKTKLINSPNPLDGCETGS